MELNSILYPIISIGGMGLIFGAVLGYAGKLFYVEEDPKIGEIKAVLPGANCGGCGLAGCDAFANAVVAGEAAVSGCPVGGETCASAVAEIMGVEAGEAVRLAAYVKCAGTCDKAKSKYDYVGLQDCRAVHLLANSGHKDCTYGCLGNGSCILACDYDAITIEDGVAVIHPDKCVNCGRCVATCPRHLIDIVPVNKTVRVACNSLDNGKIAKQNCSVACIGCKLCQKTCGYDAITVDRFLAKIDYDKCTGCRACVEKCPTKAIEG